MKSRSKKQSQHGVSIGSSLQQFPTVKVHSTILGEKGVMSILLSQMDLSGVSAISAKHWYLSSLESAYLTPVDLEILNFRPKRQHFK